MAAPDDTVTDCAKRGANCWPGGWGCCLYWESPPTVTCSWCGAHVSGPLPNPNRADNPVRHGCCGACYQGLLAELEQDCETGAAGLSAGRSSAGGGKP